MNQHSTVVDRTLFHRLSAIAQAAIILLAVIMPLLVASNASAAVISNRQVTISTSEVSTAATYIYEFDFASQAVQSIRFQFCDNPLPAVTCALPAGMDVSYGNVAISGHTGFPTNGTAFAEVTADTGACNDVSANNNTETMYCVNRTQAGAAVGTDATVTLTGVTNPSTETTVYIRIQLYTDNAFATPGDNGTVAAATAAQLTINGRVQERLEFCVSAVDDTYDTVATLTGVDDCIALTDVNVDIGVIDESAVYASPVNVTATNGADDDYGILMVNTNAQGGAVLSYYAEDPTSVSGGDTDQLKAFRVVPADCNASAATLNDQCFQSALNAGAGSAIAAGTERFGMYVPCIMRNDGTLSTTNNLTTIDADYDGSDNDIAAGADCENEANTNVGWNSGATADTIVSSSTVVDDEIVKLRFAATASASTPPGSYTVTTTYIATATF